MQILKHQVQVVCSEASTGRLIPDSRSISYVYEALKQIIVLLRLPCPGITKVSFFFSSYKIRHALDTPNDEGNTPLKIPHITHRCIWSILNYLTYHAFIPYTIVRCPPVSPNTSFWFCSKILRNEKVIRRAVNDFGPNRDSELLTPKRHPEITEISLPATLVDLERSLNISGLCIFSCWIQW